MWCCAIAASSDCDADLHWGWLSPQGSRFSGQDSGWNPGGAVLWLFSLWLVSSWLWEVLKFVVFSRRGMLHDRDSRRGLQGQTFPRSQRSDRAPGWISNPLQGRRHVGVFLELRCSSCLTLNGLVWVVYKGGLTSWGFIDVSGFCLSGLTGCYFAHFLILLILSGPYLCSTSHRAFR